MRAWFLLLLPSFAAHAQALTWQESVHLASANNAQLRSAEANLGVVREQEQASLSTFFPQISATMNYLENDASKANGEPKGTYGAGVSASQNLFNGFQDAARVAQAKAAVRAAQASLQIVKAQLSVDLKTAFQGMRYASEFTRLTAEITHRREENLRLVDLSFQSGRENKGSVLLSQAYLNQARFEDLQASNAVRVARTLLVRALGIEETQANEPGHELIVNGDVPVSEPHVVDMRQAALQTPEYLQAIAQEDSASSNIDVAHAGFFPTLALVGSAGRAGASFFPDDRNLWSVGVNFTLPLFNGGRDLHGTRAAVAARAAADFDRSNIARLQLTKLEQGFAAYVEAVSKLKVDDSFLHAAQVRAEIARKKYSNGLLTFEDWDLIENDLISRQKNDLASRRDRVISEAAWEQTQGRGAI